MIALLCATLTLSGMSAAPSDDAPSIAIACDPATREFSVAAKLPGQDWEDVLLTEGIKPAESIVFFDLSPFGWRTLELHLHEGANSAELTLPDELVLPEYTLLDSPEALNQFGLHQTF